MGRLRNVLLTGGLLCASLAFSLLLAEGLVRLVAPQQTILKRPDIWMPVDTLGWAHRPHLETRINTGERTVEVHTDEDGHRVGREGRVEADTRILVLGDSFMEAFQVEYEQSVPGLLERRLPESLERRVAVRNTAVGGWEPSQYLLQARTSLQEEEFDLVILALYLKNDILERRRDHFPPRAPTEVHRFSVPDGLSRDALIDSILYPLNDFLEVRSHLFQLFKRRADHLLMKLGLTAAYFPDVFYEREADSPRWRVTAQISAEIAELAAERSVPTLVLLIPPPGRVNPDEFERYVRGFGIDPAEVDMEQPAALLSESLRDERMFVVDASRALISARAQGERQYGEVDQHLTPAGHETVAEVLLPAVIEHLSGSAEGPQPGVFAGSEESMTEAVPTAAGDPEN